MNSAIHIIYKLVNNMVLAYTAVMCFVCVCVYSCKLLYIFYTCTWNQNVVQTEICTNKLAAVKFYFVPCYVYSPMTAI